MPTALVVGASRGLGLAIVEELLARGWSVTATVRDAAALAPRDRLRVELLDVTDWAAVDGFAARLDGVTLDLLFVNAGILSDRDVAIGAVDPDRFAQIMLTNGYAPLRLIDAVDDRVAADGTVAVMSSGLGSIARNESGGWESYRMSKAALAMGLRSVAVRDRARRTWLAVVPGWVKTDMGGDEAPLTIEQSIPGLVAMLERRRGSGGVRLVDYRDEELAW